MAEHRIPSLDGARAISIGLVIIAHLDLGHDVPGLWRVDTGNLGVRVFFVISGFIITTLLLAELRDTGSVSLTSFYRRRIFRIFPAFYLFLGAVVVLSTLQGRAVVWTRVWPAGAFLGDYVDLPLQIGHTWSLAVEEQFYLLWPAALVVLGLRRSHAGCIAILFAAPMFRLLSSAGLWPTNPRCAFECVADAVAVGCLLALMRESLWKSAAYRTIAGSPLGVLPLLAALGLIAVERNAGVIYYTLGLSTLNIGIALALDHYMRVPESLGGRVLNAAPVVWVGLISYSLYLWQQVFAWTAFSVLSKIFFMTVCAATSYYAVERPFQKIRRWMEGYRTAMVAEQSGAA